MADVREYFRIEARQILDGLARGVMELERVPSEEVVERLLRLAHTLKGAARIVGELEIGEVAHAMEDELAVGRNGGTIDRSMIDRVLVQVDAVGALIARLDGQPAEANQLHLRDQRTEPVREAPWGAGVRVGLEQIDALASELRTLQGLVRRLEGDARALVDRRVGALMNRVEELRLVSVSSVVVEAERAARDAAQSLDKDVVFAVLGEETRVDAGVMDAIRPALLHLVRNAVAHGIENVDRRLARGKPTNGQVELCFERVGPRLCITCRDDGGGVDLGRLQEVAQRQGLTMRDDPRGLLELLSEDGLSTSNTLTEISGRGIGMGIVMETVRRLRGHAELTTSATGTAITLDVPVSLASVQVLRVAAGEARALVPLDAVRHVAAIPSSGERVTVGSEVLRHIPLCALLATAHVESRVAVIVEADGERVALGVETTLGSRSAVLQPLPGEAIASDLVLGLWVDVDEVELALAPEALVHAQASLPATSKERRTPRILVVDDSITTRMLEKSILESAGFDVDLAASGEEGLDLVHAGSYDAMVVDVEMPGISGFDVIARIRADPELSGLPAILVTSLSDPDHVRRGEAVGANGYLIKSEFNQDALLQKLRMLMGAA